MKQLLKENGGLPASILWTLAIVAGVSVANIYYIQPLLNMIRHELGISEFRTNLIAMVTQNREPVFLITLQLILEKEVWNDK